MSPVSSNESYVAFVKSAYGFLHDNPVDAHLEVGSTVSHLYDLYCDYDSNKTAGRKVPLKGEDLYKSLYQFLGYVGKRLIVAQSVENTLYRHTSKLRKEFKTQSQSFNPKTLSPSAERFINSYIHVYPLGTTIGGNNKITAPDGRTAPNWRIGVNVEPKSIAAAAGPLMYFMERSKYVDHIKFESPDAATKPDSIIIYLSKGGSNGADEKEYAKIRASVVKDFGLRNVSVSPKFAPMWNEFKSGYAEASQPPRSDLSFGTYRCILAYLAFPQSRTEASAIDEAAYRDCVDDTFESFGIPRYMPHEQGPLYNPPVSTALQRRFMAAFALYNGESRYGYQDSRLDVQKSDP